MGEACWLCWRSQRSVIRVGRARHRSAGGLPSYRRNRACSFPGSRDWVERRTGRGERDRPHPIGQWGARADELASQRVGGSAAATTDPSLRSGDSLRGMTERKAKTRTNARTLRVRALGGAGFLPLALLPVRFSLRPGCRQDHRTGGVWKRRMSLRGHRWAWPTGGRYGSRQWCD